MSENSIGPSRREFLKIAGMTTAYTGCSSFLFQRCNNEPRIEPDRTLFEIFEDPKAEARPFFRWWWNGQKPKKRSFWSTVQLYPHYTWKSPNRSA